MTNMNRRTVLSAAAAAAALGGSGLATGTVSDGEQTIASAQFQFDAANTGHVETVGPKQHLAERWEFERGWIGVKHSVAVVDGTVYLGMIDGNLDGGKGSAYALDADTGEQRWKTELTGMPTVSPAVADGTVYVGDTSNVHALDAETGAIRWSFEHPATSSPTVVGDALYVGTGDGLYALDRNGGGVRWQFTEAVETVPAVADDTVYVVGERHDGETGTDYGVVFALAADAGTERWRTTVDSLSTPTVADGTVYVGSNRLTALDTKTGETRWRAATGGGAAGAYSSAVADGVVYHVAEGSALDHDSSVFAFDAETGEQRWEYAHDGVDVISSPVVADGIVYVAQTTGGLFALEAESGALVGQLTQGGRKDVRAAPVVPHDGTLYFGTVSYAGTDGSLVAVTEDESASTAEPSVELDARPETPRQGEPVTFRVSAQANDDAVVVDRIVEYRWDFDGDGKSDRTTDSGGIEHTFEEAGTHEVSVTVEDSFGWTATETVTVEVQETEFSPPTARIETTPADAEEKTLPRGATVELDASSSTAPDGEISGYEWDTGGNGTDYERTGRTIEIEFEDACGTQFREVVLRVTDRDGETDTATVRLRTE